MLLNGALNITADIYVSTNHHSHWNKITTATEIYGLTVKYFLFLPLDSKMHLPSISFSFSWTDLPVSSLAVYWGQKKSVCILVVSESCTSYNTCPSDQQMLTAHTEIGVKCPYVSILNFPCCFGVWFLFWFLVVWLVLFCFSGGWFFVNCIINIVRTFSLRRILQAWLTVNFVLTKIRTSC